MAEEGVVEAEKIESPGANYYDGMVDNLVTQFSSALDCFRELVQNSIDAGSPRVDVWTEYLPGEGHEGTIAIHVDDYGEGMDEAVIDNQFTQLFASTKDDDLTKIGKFGIGFVSVFALRPRAVLVHTGKNGEYWEVLFHEDRSFSKTQVDNPVEGTQMTLFLVGEYHYYQQLVEDIPKTLRHWCSHSEVEVTFEDRTNNHDFAPPEVINEDFLVPGECLTRVEHQGTEIVMAFNPRPIYGFYNRGLTLALTDVGENVLDQWSARFEFIAFKIKSRYLEHTLSRDSVVRDEHYEKAMTLLEEAANGPLLSTLCDEIEKLAGAEVLQVDEFHRYGLLLGYLSREPLSEILKRQDRKLLRCVNGPAISLAQAWTNFKAQGRVLLDEGQSELSTLLARESISVILNAGRPSWEEGNRGRRPAEELLLRGLTQLASRSVRGVYWKAVHFVKSAITDDDSTAIPHRIRRAMVTPQSAYVPVELDENRPKELDELVKAAFRLLSHAKTGYRTLATGVVRTEGGEAPFFVVGPRISALMARPPEGVEQEERKKMEALVNREHPQFAVIQEVYRRDPAMGAYLLARGLLLSEDHMLEADSALLQASLSDEAKTYRVG